MNICKWLEMMGEIFYVCEMRCSRWAVQRGVAEGAEISAEKTGVPDEMEGTMMYDRSPGSRRSSYEIDLRPLRICIRRTGSGGAIRYRGTWSGFDLSKFHGRCGAVNWKDKAGRPCTAVFSLDPARPLITSIAVNGKVVISRAQPVYRASTGKRRGGFDQFFDFPPSHPEGTRSFLGNLQNDGGPREIRRRPARCIV